MFTTKRLQLRAYKATDEAELLALYNNAAVVPFITEAYIVPRGPSYTTTFTWIEKAMMFCIIEERVSGDFVGWTSFMNPPDARNRNGKFGIAFLPQFWSQGLGTELMEFMVGYAFRSLGLHRVELEVFDGNDRAMALYRRMGFVVEGKKRENVWTEGRWCDMYYMAILEHEWAEKQEKIRSLMD